MVICDFCNDSLFSPNTWINGEKEHHKTVERWAESLSNPCTICIRLFENVQEAIIGCLEPGTVLKEDISPHLNNVLPLYTVILQPQAAREQYKLLFRPIEENVRKLAFSTTSGKVENVALDSQNFHMYSTKYDVSNVHPKLSADTSDAKRTLRQIQKWVADCETDDHKHCHVVAKPADDRIMIPPTRLLDLENENPNIIKLIDTGGDSQKFTLYATLSHCWGIKEMPLLLTDKTLARFLAGVPLDEFPNNFKDAIQIARLLKIRWMWIDSLCIIQKQPDRADWRHEGPLMHRVYGNSFLNIAAAGSRDCTGGLFRHRRAAALEPSTVHFHWQAQERTCRIVREDFWSGELLTEPLYKRGWVVQERMLSARTLHFGSRQVFWQCLTTSACETMPDGLPRAISDAGRDELRWRQLLKRDQPAETDIDDQIDLQELWRHAVETYTGCDLTWQSDKFPGIAGLAKQMSDVSKEQWIAGFWHKRLIDQLAWHVRRYKRLATWQKSQEGEWRAPSWSWPSVNGVVEIPRRVMDNRIDLLEIIGEPDVHLATSEQPFGELTSGRLKVEGTIYRATFVNFRGEESWKWKASTPNGQGAWCFLHPDRTLETTDAADQESAWDALFIPLYYTQTTGVSGKAIALVEHRDGEGESLSESYARVGLIEFREFSEETLSDLISQPLYDSEANNDGESEPRIITLV